MTVVDAAGYLLLGCLCQSLQKVRGVVVPLETIYFVNHVIAGVKYFSYNGLALLLYVVYVKAYGVRKVSCNRSRSGLKLL